MTKDGKSCSKSGKESWAAGAADRALLSPASLQMVSFPPCSSWCPSGRILGQHLPQLLMTKDCKSSSKSGKESWAAGAADRALLSPASLQMVSFPPCSSWCPSGRLLGQLLPQLLMTKDGKSSSKSGKESWAADAADRAVLPYVTPDAHLPTMILMVPIRTTFSRAFTSTFNDQGR